MWHFIAVYPDKCNIKLAAIDDRDLHDKHVAFWEDVYGFKMSCMKSDVVKEASVDLVKPERIISDQVIVKVISFVFLAWKSFSLTCWLLIA